MKDEAEFGGSQYERKRQKTVNHIKRGEYNKTTLNGHWVGIVGDNCDVRSL